MYRELGGGNAAKGLEASYKFSYQELYAKLHELRSYVCAQCHVEYYCSSKMPLTFPRGKGLKVEQQEAFWNETRFPDGERFFDYKHSETGAPNLKVQHPEFELWSQGVHARAGVACADCHMPYQCDGASQVSDHWVRSPLLNVANACQTCHKSSEAEIRARVDLIQQRDLDLMQRGGKAIVASIDAINAAKKEGALPEQLKDALASSQGRDGNSVAAYPAKSNRCASIRCRTVKRSAAICASSASCSRSKAATSSALKLAPMPRQARMRPHQVARVKAIGSSYQNIARSRIRPSARSLAHAGSGGISPAQSAPPQAGL